MAELSATVTNVQLLLGTIGDELLLELYERKARESIMNYCNLTELPTTFNTVIEDIMVFKYRNRGNENLASEMMGARSSSFLSSLPSDIMDQISQYRSVRVL